LDPWISRGQWMPINLDSAPWGYATIFVVNDALTTRQRRVVKAHGAWLPLHPYNNFEPASTVFKAFSMTRPEIIKFVTFWGLPHSQWSTEFSSHHAPLYRKVACIWSVTYAENFHGRRFQSAKIFLCTKIESMIRKNIKQAAIQYVNVVKQL